MDAKCPDARFFAPQMLERKDGAIIIVSSIGGLRGNSLIGVTPGLDITEIPDDAFQPVTGDDRATATALRKRNKKEREGQIAFQFGSGETAGSAERHAGKRAQMVAAIENLPEREQYVMSMYYEHDMNLKEIAAVLGVTESRVCQLHSQSIARLRARLREW